MLPPRGLRTISTISTERVMAGVPGESLRGGLGGPTSSLRRLGLGLERAIGREQDAHPPPVQRRRSLHLAHVGQLLQDGVEDAPPLLLVLHLAAAKEDGDQDLVVVPQELPRLVHLGRDVVLTRLGADADLLQLLLAGLAALVVLLRVL